MSWWFYEGRIVRIKQEFQTDFGYLFEEQYDKIKAPEIREFVSEIYEKPYYDNIAIPIKKFPNSIDGSVFVFGGKHLQMAEGLFSYVGIPAIDFTNFLAGNIVSMAGMFTEFRTDGSLDLSGLDASRVWNMDEMFRTCDVHGLDLSSFDLTDKHTYRMFTDCSAQEIIIPSDFLHGAMKIYHDLIYSLDFDQEKICLFLENKKLFKQLDETHSEEDSERLYQETGIRIRFKKTYYQRMESCS